MALTYNIGTWPQMTGGEEQLWTSGVLRLYKTVFHRLYPSERQFHMTNDEVLSLTGLPSPDFLLKFHRVTQFGHYLHRHCDYFWALAGQDRLWLDLVTDNLKSIYEQIKGLTRLPDLQDASACEEWQQFWQAYPKKFAGLLKRARAHHIGQIQLRFEVSNIHERIYDTLFLAGLPHHGDEVAMPQQPHACLVCSTAWPTYRAWAVHAFK